MAKFELNLQQINQLCTNITVISVNKGWFEVAESDKKIHGSKKLLEFNDNFEGKKVEVSENTQVNTEVSENTQEEDTNTEENVQVETPETPVKPSKFNRIFKSYSKLSLVLYRANPETHTISQINCKSIIMSKELGKWGKSIEGLINISSSLAGYYESRGESRGELTVSKPS